MYYTATAHSYANPKNKVKENFDDFNELQNFMNKMEKRGFLEAVVTGTEKGKSVTIKYQYGCDKWNIISQTFKSTF